MRWPIVLSVLLFLETSTALSKKYVSIPFQRHKRKPTGLEHSKRSQYVNAVVGNAVVLYYTNLTVGHPPQPIQLQIDTGSSDIWMSDSTTAFCRYSRYNCLGGTFNPSQSTTYRPIPGQKFEIQYIDNSYARGNYFTDDITIAGYPVQNLQMGLALQTTIGSGIMGIGFAADESICAQQRGPCQTYPTLVQSLVSAGKIHSQAYSLYLNDQYAATGQLLFGAIDTGKFTGALTALPIQRDAYSGGYTSFTVVLSGFSLKTSSGSQSFGSSNVNIPAILDSGTSIMVLPDAIANALTKEFKARYYPQYQIYVSPCSLGQTTATFDFQFGGANGPTIKVPIGQVFEPLTDANGRPATLPNGELACEFGLQPTAGRPVLLGDTFLRAAYVVYDLDNLQVSIAATNFNSTSSNIVEIKAGKNGVPSVSGTASAASAAQTVTGPIGGGGFGSLSASPTPLSGSPAGSGPVTITSFVGASPTGSGSGKTSGGAVPGLKVPAKPAMLGLFTLLVALGSCFVLL